MCRPLLLAALCLLGLRAHAGPTYVYKAHRFLQVPIITVEREDAFLLGFFPRQPDALGERLDMEPTWLGPDSGYGRLLLHRYPDGDEIRTDVLVLRDTEPVPSLAGTLSVPGPHVDVVDLDGDALPELLYSISLDKLLKERLFSVDEYPVVDVVLAWDASARRYTLANQAHRIFLASRLDDAYEALQSPDEPVRRKGLVALAFYFFGTGQADEGRALLARHAPDPTEQKALEQAFARIVEVPWKSPCTCHAAWACHAASGICQPKGVAKEWSSWPRRVALHPERLELKPGPAEKAFWDEDRSEPDPFIEIAVDAQPPVASPPADDTLSAEWLWQTEVLLYPPSVLRLVVKDKDPGLDQPIARKSLTAAALFDLAAENEGVATFRLRNVRSLRLRIVPLTR